MEPQEPHSEGNEPQGPMGGEDPTKAFADVGNALTQMLQGLSSAGAPPEALAALEAANKAYEQFLSIIGSSPQGAPKGSEVANANASGPGVNPVPSM